MTTFWYKGKQYVSCRIHKDCDCIFDRPSVAQMEKWRIEDGYEDNIHAKLVPLEDSK